MKDHDWIVSQQLTRMSKHIDFGDSFPPKLPLMLGQEKSDGATNWGP
jgi:hypothetical protein